MQLTLTNAVKAAGAEPQTGVEQPSGDAAQENLVAGTGPGGGGGGGPRAGRGAVGVEQGR